MERHIDSWHRLRALQPSVIFTFGYGGVSHSPDKTLQWAEEDVRAVERICREGMKRKTGSDEMARRVQEYYDQIGAMTPAEAGRRMRLEAQRQEYW